LCRLQSRCCGLTRRHGGVQFIEVEGPCDAEECELIADCNQLETPSVDTSDKEGDGEVIVIQSIENNHTEDFHN
jgi:hypothetical protein